MLSTLQYGGGNAILMCCTRGEKDNGELAGVMIADDSFTSPFLISMHIILVR